MVPVVPAELRRQGPALPISQSLAEPDAFVARHTESELPKPSIQR